MNPPSCHLHIGPIDYRLTTGGASPLRYDGWAYRDFYKLAADFGSRHSLAVFPVHIVPGSGPLPSGAPLYAAGGNWAVWRDQDGWLFCAGAARRERPRFTCRIPTAFDQATLYVDEDPTDAPLRYPLDQVLTWGLLGRCGGLLLHAAAVERDGIGYVLAGRSGAGKSTLSALCHDQGLEIFNDDRVIVYPDAAGSWRVAGTPWHGSGSYAKNRSAPLRGVYLLSQATANRIGTLPLRQARLSLLDVAAIPWFEADWAQASLDALERLTSEVPVRRFGFTRSPEAVEALLGMEAVA